jgi:putative transmembrane protein PGPGW
MVAMKRHDENRDLAVLRDARNELARSIRPNRAGRLKDLAVEIAGWALVVAGVAGLFLPVLQGVLMLLAGLLILSSRHRWASHLIGKLLVRFPSLSGRIREASECLKERAVHGESDQVPTAREAGKTRRA